MGLLPDVRAGERRGVFASFFTLLGITAAHVLLETARDALFLAKLPASQLPWMYMAIAGIGLVLALAGRKRKSRGHLVPALLGSAALTLGFWFASDSESPVFLYALYLWTGTYASFVVLQFWLLLGASYQVDQAKRIFGFIGAGSVLGAVLGATAARALAEVVAARHLLVAASILLAITCVPALALARPTATPVAGKLQSFAGELRTITTHPYVRRILLLVLLSTVTVTAVDYLFKAAVADGVPDEELGAFFATIQIALNSGALVVQVFGVGWVMRRFGIHRAVWIMPVLLAGGAGAVIAGGGLIAAVALKGVDGGLRHSLHKTSTELLYVPMPDALRSRAKPLIDLVAQRGGQAIASLAILGLIAAGLADEITLAIVIGVLSLAWITAVAGIRRHYLDLFRQNLKQGRIDYEGDLPQLDLEALEALFAALNSSKDAEVIGALDLLAAQGRKGLIPALILYHPSRNVVQRALELFVSEGRTDFVPIAERLLTNPDLEVRAAALRAIAAVRPNEAFLRARMADECLEVRATAITALVANDWLTDDEAGLLADLMTSPPAVRIALARAIAKQPTPRLEKLLVGLRNAPEPEVQLEVAWAMGRTGNAEFVPELISLLPYSLQGTGARDALLDLGVPALAALDRAMSDPKTPDLTRWALPRAISMFAPAIAAPVLLHHLEAHEDGLVRYRILRALGRLRAIDPDLPLDRELLARVAEATTRDACRLLEWRMILTAAADKQPARNTPVGRLVGTLLRDRETHAMGRLFRLLGLLHPGESFERIQRGLHSKDARARASARELCENLVHPAAHRDALLCLIDDLADAERLARLPASFRIPAITADELLHEMIRRGGHRGQIVAYHAGELGMKHEGAPIDLASVLVRRSSRRAATTA